MIAGHIDGMLRAYDSASGKVLWQTDTTWTYPTANGAAARGGAMSALSITFKTPEEATS